MALIIKLMRKFGHERAKKHGNNQTQICGSSNFNYSKLGEGISCTHGHFQLGNMSNVGPKSK